MPVFMYVSRDSAGNIVQGHQEAPSEAAAVSILQNKGLYVTHVINTAVAIKSAKKARKRKRKLGSEDRLFFIAQTANLLTVGIPFVRSMEVIAELTESQKMYDVIQELIANIKSGSTFKDAIARHPKVFPAYWSFLIEAGEISGSLPRVLTQLAKNMEATENLRKKVASAMVYPAVLITASFAAIVFFMMFIVPIFAKLFASFNAELPFITRLILGISNFLKTNALLIFGGGFAVFFFARKYLSSPKGQQAFHGILLNFPVLGGAASDIIHARIGIILSMLIRSGLSFLKSLEITANVSGNYIFETALNNIRLEVQQGKTLSTSLSEHAIFSPMFINLVKIGEESGKLPEMVEKASEYFAQRVEIFASRISVLIEPVVMILVGGVIGVIGVSIFMPIIKLTSAIH
jgi:type IV pilus assembly protein PilC